MFLNVSKNVLPFDCFEGFEVVPEFLGVAVTGIDDEVAVLVFETTVDGEVVDNTVEAVSFTWVAFEHAFFEDVVFYLWYYGVTGLIDCIGTDSLSDTFLVAFEGMPGKECSHANLTRLYQANLQVLLHHGETH